jgi:hypothetical protein
MTISTKLTTEQRIEVLKVNREEIISEIYFVNGERSEEGKKEIMTILLSIVKSEDFYSNFLNSFEGVKIVDLLQTIENDRNTDVSDDEGAQEYFQDELEKRMGTYSRKFN